jgi:diguanylate cyclase (GGDEF)-like protein/PAS domain S-box-containing protein
MGNAGTEGEDVLDQLAATRLDPSQFRTLADALPIGAVMVDQPGRFAYVNDAWREITGYTGPLPLPLEHAIAMVHDDDREEVLHGLLHDLEDHGHYHGRSRTVRPDGTVRWVDMRAQLLPSEPGQWAGFVGSLVDVTDLRVAELAMTRSEARFRELIEHSPVGQALFDGNGAVIHANRAYAAILGQQPWELVGIRTLALVHPEDRAALTDRLDLLLSGELTVLRAEVRMQRSDGSWRWVQAAGSLLAADADAEWAVAVTDITEAREAQDQLREMAAIVETTSDLVATLDPFTGDILYLNPAASACYGRTGDADLTIADLYSQDALSRYAEEILPVLRCGQAWSGELEMLRSDGDPLHTWQTIHAERDSTGNLTRVSSVGRDVTQRREAEAELAWAATHDPLTGLPNRALLLERLEYVLEANGPNGSAVMFLDLDRFKSVNDTLGHDAGDDLLIQVAERIRAYVRPDDVVARLGGDEFVVLCHEVEDDRHAMTVGQRVLEAIEGKPFVVDSVELGMSASLGIALSSRGEHAEVLLRDADAAMYRAKENGRARLELFDEVMRRRSHGRVDMAEQLSDAIEEGQITVLYQPLVDLESGQISGVEALARWAHPERGLLAPYEFIGLAEDTGLIVGLGLSILQQACEQAQRWSAQLGGGAPQVHVNISARQLSQSNLPVLVRGVLDKVGVPPSLLCLEVTESVLMEDARAATKVLGDLKGIGIDLAIDDFGTGYSSLSYLRRFPVDVLKVDRSFIDGLGDDPEDSAIVAAVISLAHTLDLRAVAEGVETETQLAELRALGCDAAQGYLFAKPIPADELTALLLTQHHQ